MSPFSFAAGEIAHHPILLNGATHTKTEKLVSTIEDIKETTLRLHEEQAKLIKKQKVDIKCLEKIIRDLHKDIEGLMFEIAEKEDEIKVLKGNVETLVHTLNFTEEENVILENKNKRIRLAIESFVQNELD